MCLMLLLVLAGTGRVVASSAMGEAGNISADFTRLDWNALRIDSVLPTYTEVIPLESDYRNYDSGIS